MFMELLACNEELEQFKDRNCKNSNNARWVLEDYNITLEFKNKDFINTEYKSEYASYGA